MLHGLFLYLVQVCCDMNHCSFRSDYHFLLLLFIFIFPECWEALILLLLLGRDIELNPGPQTQEYLLREILADQNEIKNEISELRKQHLRLNRCREVCQV